MSNIDKYMEDILHEEDRFFRLSNNEQLPISDIEAWTSLQKRIVEGRGLDTWSRWVEEKGLEQ